MIPATNRRMSAVSLPPCPHLPAPRARMDWRALHIHRGDVRSAEFYSSCLEYGHDLWQRGLAARAILCLDRALFADLRGDETVLAAWPLPYAAIVWMLKNTPPGVFIGNPRVHFQHLADRMNEPRREQRRWRAWACWALTCAALPQLAGDPLHVVDEPSLALVEEKLRIHGHPGEPAQWRAVLHAVRGC